VCQCNQDIDIINNEFSNWGAGVNIQPYDASCTTQYVDDVVIDRNLIQGTAALSHGAVYVTTGSGNYHAQDVTITNNMMITSITDGWQAHILWQQGTGGSGDIPGTVTIVNNTLSGNVGGFWPGLMNFHGSGLAQQDWIIKNNIFQNVDTGEPLIWFDYAPTGAVIDDNIYPASGSYWGWNDTQYSTLANWQTALGGCPGTGNDCAADRCTVSFVGSGDFHLQSGDTCAKDQGSDQSSVTTWDYDGNPRPVTNWDVGADEYGCHGG
jgi:hypothetical protein